MSYPEPRYAGETGQVSAVRRPAEAPAEVVSPEGGTIHYLATQATTEGDFGLYRLDMAPQTPGPRAHFHRSIAESFFVLAGTVTLFDGQRWASSQTGDFLYVPAGGLHGFRNDSPEPASMLLLFTPGAPREEYFERLGEMVRHGGEELAEFLVRHDTFFVDAEGDPRPV
ncbi:cupin domain-containing protein [Streptomyces sp. N2-109]|uniref:Cupin domain-containing protein n=1 Tax=Streptomyces gossypii TaxID=2883101 RepID=A0ABT2JYK7_9ACTN|nr:cupin domain-containing protein [Streptomyces gossypii]MCT2592921.1 cupin domain-containing protein [Streptomyces gossypii]